MLQQLRKAQIKRVLCRRHYYHTQQYLYPSPEEFQLHEDTIALQQKNRALEIENRQLHALLEQKNQQAITFMKKFYSTIDDHQLSQKMNHHEQPGIHPVTSSHGWNNSYTD